MKWIWLSLGLLLGAIAPTLGKTVQFCGYDWTVRSGRGGPGPNQWDENNVWVDGSGNLHLGVTHWAGRWSCAEVTLQKRLGFGRYEFQVDGPIGRLDDNVVLGFFSYPTSDVGPDGTNEIDIEFARWGKASNPIGNYTVWPAEAGLKQQSKAFSFTLETDPTTHRFVWSSESVLFQSLRGGKSSASAEFGRWDFHPGDVARRIAQRSMPVHINLWLFQGHPPKDGREVELVVRRFSFAPI